MKTNGLNYFLSLLPGITISIVSIVPAYSQKEYCWNIFRGDQALNGTTAYELPSQPVILWTFKTDDELKSSPVSCSNKIIAGSGDGFIYCLDLNGKLLWKFDTGNGIEAPALILDGNVYVGNLDGSLYCLNLNTGRQNWVYRTDNQISGSPNYWKIDETTFILVGSYDYNLHCVDVKTGKLKWKYESDNFINGAPACHNGFAIFGGCDGYLHMVDIKSGTLKEKVAVATYVASSSAISGNFAYLGDYDGVVSCVNLKEQKISWHWQDEITNLPFMTSPSVLKDRVIIGNDNKYLYCLDKMNGKLLWKFNTGSKVESSTVASPGKVLTANMRGDLFMLDINSGKKLWSYETGTPISGTPAVLKDKFVVASTTGYIYCFGVKK